MTTDALAGVIGHVARVMIDHADELNALDRAIGDGDHGTNATRGFQAVLRRGAEWRELAPSQAIEMVGRLLVMTVGGAFGPLVGTAFITLGQALPRDPAAADVARAATAALAAVKARGRSDVGHKTLIDVLEPVCSALSAGADAATLKALAAAAADDTIAMRALRGRAAYLGARSIGHMDPGARSASLMITAALDALARTDNRISTVTPAP